jgi:hypothetical protein
MQPLWSYWYWCRMALGVLSWVESWLTDERRWAGVPSSIWKVPSRMRAAAESALGLRWASVYGGPCHWRGCARQRRKHCWGQVQELIDKAAGRNANEPMSSLVNELELPTLWSKGEGRWVRVEITEVSRTGSRGSRVGMLSNRFIAQCWRPVQRGGAGHQLVRIRTRKRSSFVRESEGLIDQDATEEAVYQSQARAKLPLLRVV